MDDDGEEDDHAETLVVTERAGTESDTVRSAVNDQAESRTQAMGGCVRLALGLVLGQHRVRGLFELWWRMRGVRCEVLDAMGAVSIGVDRRVRDHVGAVASLLQDDRTGRRQIID